jgi:hypothetical protein
LALGDDLAKLGREPFVFSHGLVGDPLLGRDALAEVADRRPAHQIEHHLGDLPLLLPTGAAPQLPLGPADIVRDLDDNGCWAALFNVDAEAAYRELLDACLAPVGALPRTEGAMGRSAAHVFCAAPHTVVPVHFDRYHNLLLQIEGTKTVTIGAYDDPAVAQREIERRFSHAENPHVAPPISARYVLAPGDGLHIPPYAFHWVTNGDQSSVSFSCTFHTARTARSEAVHACNARLRRLGLRPRPPGNGLRDACKIELLRARRRLVTLRRRRRERA